MNTVRLKFSDDHGEIDPGQELKIRLQTSAKKSDSSKTQERILFFLANESFTFQVSTQTSPFTISWNAFHDPDKNVLIQVQDQKENVLASFSTLANELLIVDQENRIPHLDIPLTEHGRKSFTGVSLDICFADGRMDDRVRSEIRDAQLRNLRSNGHVKHLQNVISWVEAWNNEDAIGCKLRRVPILQTTLLESSIRMANEDSVRKLKALGAMVTKEALKLARSEKNRPSDVCTDKAAEVCSLVEAWYGEFSFKEGQGSSLSDSTTSETYDGLQGPISRVTKSWLFSLERTRRFDSKRCGDFDRTGRCCRGQTCLFAHVQQEGQSGCVSASPFEQALVETKSAYDDFGNKRYTAGYCDGNEFFYAFRNGGALCTSSGLWWWTTEAHAMRALKATVACLREDSQ